MGFSIKFEIHVHLNRTRNHEESKKEQLLSKNVSSVVSEPFFVQTRSEIERLKDSRRGSTLANYDCALRSFRRYLKRDIRMSEINASMLEGFERWLKDGNVCLNTISCYMRSLRSVMTRLLGESACDLFSHVYTGQAKTEKRAIPIDDILRLKDAKLRAGSFICLVRDIFLFSFYALGMPFVDVAFLRKSQVTNGQLTYYRYKTGQRIVVKLEPCMEEIICRYQSQDRSYIFPLLHSENADLAYIEYLGKLNRYNRTLKQLAKKVGIESRLTSYTPRHSWASIAYSHNVDLPVISKAFGHTNTKTTLTYIKELNDNSLSDANRIILAMCRINNY